MEATKVLEEEISSLEIEIDALQTKLWDSEDKLRNLKPAKVENASGNNGPEDEGNGSAIELTPEEKALMDEITATQTELTARQMKLQALKKRLADSIANSSEYFSKEEE